MPRCCVVKNCPSGSRKSKSQVSLFVAPTKKSLRDQWRNVIPEIDKLGSPQYVCETHFDPKQITMQPVKKDTLGTLTKRARLNPTAIPLPPESPELSEMIIVEADPENIESMSDNSQQQYAIETCPAALSEHNYAGGEVTDNNDNSDQFITLILDKLKMSVVNSACIYEMDDHSSKVKEVFLPKMWNVTDLSDDKGSRFYFTHVSMKTDTIPPLPYVDKSVLIDENHIIQYYVHNQPVPLSSKKCPNVLYDVDQMSHILKHFENHRICIGLQVNELDQLNTGGITKAYKDTFGTWRHNNCTLLAISKYCLSCSKEVHKIKVKPTPYDVQNQPIKKRSTLEYLKLLKARKELYRERRQKARAKLRAETLRQELAELKSKSIEEKCAELNMSASETLAVSEIFSAAAKKDANGHRYSDEWMNLAMRMCTRSPSFYNFLRDINILPLPCQKTVKKYATTALSGSGLESLDPLDLNVVEIVEIEEYDT